MLVVAAIYLLIVNYEGVGSMVSGFAFAVAGSMMMRLFL